jgi:hypothetical protein
MITCSYMRPYRATVRGLSKRLSSRNTRYSQVYRPAPQEQSRQPYPDFPLYPHAGGRWAKRIRGEMHYFGWKRGNLARPWQDALQKYQQQWDDRHAGRTPRVQGDGLTVADLCNRFLTSKRRLLDTREITPRTFQDNYQSCAVLDHAFGQTRLVEDLAASDFEDLRAKLAKRRGPVRLGNFMHPHGIPAAVEPSKREAAG